MRPPPANRARALRIGAVVVWSGFLTAAAATMVCFAFLDPGAFAEGAPPAWWGTRIHVYTIGFFFFWGVGIAAAALAWFLANARRATRR
jgi:hypothetical protein